MRHFQFICVLVLFFNSAFAQELMFKASSYLYESAYRLELGEKDPPQSLYESTYGLELMLGEKDPLQIPHKLAVIYHAVGQLDEALPLYEKAYRLRLQILGEKHPDTLESLNNLASIYKAVGRLDEALPLSEKAYAQSKQVLGEKHLTTLTSLNNLAVAYQAVGRLDGALPLSEKAYRLRLQVLGEKHSNTLTSLNNLANIYQAVGRLDEALPLFEKAYSLFRQVLGEKHSNTLTSLNNLASIYQAVGRLDEALPLYEKAYKLCLQALGETHPDTLTSLNNLAGIYQVVGRLDEALPLSEKAYSLFRQVLGEKHSVTLQSLNNLAGIYQVVGRLDEALPLFEKAYGLRLQVLGKTHPDTLQSLSNLAGIYDSVGRLDEALPLLEKAYRLHLQILGETHPDTLKSLNNLAGIYDSVGRLDEALPLSEKAYRLRLQVLGETHPATLKSLNNLALIYQALGRLDEALPLYEKGYTLFWQVLGETHPDTLISLNNLAFIYQAIGRLDEALPLYEKAYKLRLQALGETHPDTLTILNNLAIAYAEQGDLAKSIDYLEQLVMGAESLRRSQLSVYNRRSIFTQYIGSYFDLSQIYFLQNNYQAAFHTAEKTKARTLLESIAFKLALQQVNFTAEEHKKIEQQQTQLASLDTQIAETGELDERTRLREKKHALLEQITVFHEDLKQRYPAFASLIEAEIITAEKGRKLLPENALFISYVQDPTTHQLLVFTLDHTGKLHAHNLGVITGLAQTLSLYREALGTTIQGLRQKGKSVWQLADGSFVLGNKPSRDKKPHRIRQVDQISRYLAEKLLRPIAEQLKTKKHLIFSPSGGLAQIPFETLILDNQPLIAQHKISYAQSLSTFALLKKREAAYQELKGRQTLFAMGNPRYHAPKSPPKNCDVRALDVDLDTLSRGNNYKAALRHANNWCNLPGTQKELDTLKALYPDSTIYQQADASEAKLQSLNKDLSRYQYLHFATHGFLHPQTWALSALVLDQLNTTDEHDGYLTAVEWIGYQLKSDLMVMSACQTGLGKTVSGEGIMGLPYALYLAGNKNTLMTLWKVDDAITAEFMRRFFTKVNNGLSHIQALVDTKREFRQEKAYQNPMYWAAFVLYGV
jgi:CHAT domain-containing protein/uncharacterized protein YjgD (DUF1641 family)